MKEFGILNLPEKLGVSLLVINGYYGNGTDRTANLIKDGYEPTEIQSLVNKLLPIYNESKV